MSDIYVRRIRPQMRMLKTAWSKYKHKNMCAEPRMHMRDDVMFDYVTWLYYLDPYLTKSRLNTPLQPRSRGAPKCSFG